MADPQTFCVKRTRVGSAEKGDLLGVREGRILAVRDMQEGWGGLRQFVEGCARGILKRGCRGENQLLGKRKTRGLREKKGGVMGYIVARV